MNEEQKREKSEHEVTHAFIDRHCVFGADEITTKNVLCSIYATVLESTHSRELLLIKWSVLPQTRGVSGSEISSLFDHVLLPLLLEKGCVIDTMHMHKCFIGTMYESLSDAVISGVSVTPRVDNMKPSANNHLALDVERLLLLVQQQQDQITALTHRMEELYHAPGMPGYLSAKHDFER